MPPRVFKGIIWQYLKKLKRLLTLVRLKQIKSRSPTSDRYRNKEIMLSRKDLRKVVTNRKNKFCKIQYPYIIQVGKFKTNLKAIHKCVKRFHKR